MYMASLETGKVFRGPETLAVNHISHYTEHFSCISLLDPHYKSEVGIIIVIILSFYR